MKALSNPPPQRIQGFRVVAYGFFPRPILPAGYVPPQDGAPPIDLSENVAICTADGVEGYYILFCTPEWRYVTSCFNETLEYTKRVPMVAFGQDVQEWLGMATGP